MKSVRDIIRRPLITERATRLQESERKFLFEVASGANKIEIRRAVETVFRVKVATVNTCRVMGKEKRLGRFAGRRPGWKKAIVTLAEGQTIDFFESV